MGNIVMHDDPVLVCWQKPAAHYAVVAFVYAISHADTSITPSLIRTTEPSR